MSNLIAEESSQQHAPQQQPQQSQQQQTQNLSVPLTASSSSSSSTTSLTIAAIGAATTTAASTSIPPSSSSSSITTIITEAAAATTQTSIEHNIGDEPRAIGVDAYEQHCRLVEEELQHLRESESRYKQQYAEAQKREKMLVRRLAAKEQEMQDYANQNTELKASQAPTLAALRSVLLDPAVNILFQKLKAELQATKARLEDTQNELSAWKFTPDSNTGKRLMAKCRLLYQENEELGKMTSNGRLAKLEGDLALQKSFSEEVKKSQSELDDFLQELDEDVEGMQSTILFLQQELKLAKDQISTLEQENCLLKNAVDDGIASGISTSSCSNYESKIIYKDGLVASDNCENYLINGLRTTPIPITDTTATTTTSIFSSLSASASEKTIYGDSSSTHITNLINHNNTKLNSISNSAAAGNNSERVSAKTNSSKMTTITTPTTTPAAPSEQRTLRSRNINSVVDELRTSKLNLSKTQINIRNGNGFKRSYKEIDKGNDNNEQKAHKNSRNDVIDEENDNDDDDDDTDEDAVLYVSSDDGGDDNDDIESGSGKKYKIHSKNISKNNNNKNSNSSLLSSADALSSIVSCTKKARRSSSVLSLDLNEEDSQIDLKIDERPLNLVTPGSGTAATASSSPDIRSSTANGIV